MFNGMAIVSVGAFNGDVDKNGKHPVILNPFAGTIPSKRVLSGTIAENAGLIPGNTYLVNFSEQDEDAEYGRQFSWTNGGKSTVMENLQAKALIGEGTIQNVEDDAPVRRTIGEKVD